MHTPPLVARIGKEGLGIWGCTGDGTGEGGRREPGDHADPKEKSVRGRPPPALPPCA